MTKLNFPNWNVPDWVLMGYDLYKDELFVCDRGMAKKATWDAKTQGKATWNAAIRNVGGALFEDAHPGIAVVLHRRQAEAATGGAPLADFEAELWKEFQHYTNVNVGWSNAKA